ncbi:hypothetical protein [Methyloprofundus sp.]|uniref:hypothetical protein n=1 Tax=Methyloprofundus sp. TaxID=2020875 RepID=UPI003D13A2F4
MYELKVKKASASKISSEDLDNLIAEFIGTIETSLSEDSRIKGNKSRIVIETTMTEKEINDCVKPALHYFSDDIQLHSLTQRNKGL